MIEFLEEPHIYIWDGVIVPSVTQFIRDMNGQGSYSDVPLSVLRSKAEYGNSMHDWCETFLLYGERKPYGELKEESINQFLDIVGQKKLTLLSSEQIVGYRHSVAGKYDLLVEMDGLKTLIDIKTTYRLDKEYLSWQLSLYSLAIEETLGISVDQSGCIWLPKQQKGKYVDIERKCRAEVDKAIDERQHHADEEDVLLEW